MSFDVTYVDFLMSEYHDTPCQYYYYQGAYRRC